MSGERPATPGPSIQLRAIRTEKIATTVNGPVRKSQSLHTAQGNSDEQVWGREPRVCVQKSQSLRTAQGNSDTKALRPVKDLPRLVRDLPCAAKDLPRPVRDLPRPVKGCVLTECRWWGAVSGPRGSRRPS